MRRLALLLSLLFLPLTAGAADLSFLAPATVGAGEEFTLTVVASSTDRFNAAEATIAFPEDLLEVRSVDPSSSATVFNFWLKSPSYSNKEGIITFSGGTTRDVAGADVPLVTLRMRAKSQGSVLITAQDASINASDGKGTNILEDVRGKRITITQAALIVPPTPAPAPAPVAPVIKTPTTTTPSPTLPTAVRENEECGELFATCEVQFPVIVSVTLIPDLQTGATIRVLGTAADGDRVLLRLRRDGVFYKQVEAIIQEDGTWEALFTNVYAYGTYRIDATSYILEGHQVSEPVAWTNIRYYPLGTLIIAGMPMHWYILAAGVAGVLALMFGVLYLLSLRTVPGGAPRFRILLILSVLVLMVIAVVAYLEWRRETGRLSFWKDSAIPCIRQADSYETAFGSAELSIYVDGALQRIPAEIGITPTCVAQVHTHDDIGKLHFEITEWPVTLADFFTVAGADFERSGYVRTASVNGEDYSDRITEYALRAGDVIELRYTTKP